MGENEYDGGGAVNDRMSGGGENEIRFRSSGGVSAWGMENLSVLCTLMVRCSIDPAAMETGCMQPTQMLLLVQHHCMSLRV